MEVEGQGFPDRLTLTTLFEDENDNEHDEIRASGGKEDRRYCGRTVRRLNLPAFLQGKGQWTQMLAS